MALETEKVVDKVECLCSNFHFIQIREKTVVKDDGEVVDGLEKFHRRTLVPGYKDSSDNYQTTDTEDETHPSILAIIGTWTAQIHSDYADHLGATYI